MMRSLRAVAIAATICLVAVTALDLFAAIAVSETESDARSAAAIAASSIQAQARVRQSSSHRIPRAVASQSVAPVSGSARIEQALTGLPVALTNRERLAQLTILRI